MLDSGYAAIIANQGRMDTLLTATRFLKERIRQITYNKFNSQLRDNKITEWPADKDPYNYLKILEYEHLHLFSDPAMRRILTNRKRVYDFDTDISIVCQEFSRDYE